MLPFSFLNGPEREQSSESSGEEDEKDAGAGVSACACGRPRGGIERSSGGGKENHFHGGHGGI